MEKCYYGYWEWPHSNGYPHFRIQFMSADYRDEGIYIYERGARGLMVADSSTVITNYITPAIGQWQRVNIDAGQNTKMIAFTVPGTFTGTVRPAGYIDTTDPDMWQTIFDYDEPGIFFGAALYQTGYMTARIAYDNSGGNNPIVGDIRCGTWFAFDANANLYMVLWPEYDYTNNVNTNPNARYETIQRLGISYTEVTGGSTIYHDYVLDNETPRNGGYDIVPFIDIGGLIDSAGNPSTSNPIPPNETTINSLELINSQNAIIRYTYLGTNYREFMTKGIGFWHSLGDGNIKKALIIGRYAYVYTSAGAYVLKNSGGNLNVYT